ncbi:three-helix bundle dimerization domain-containing protein [Blastococcus sp. SYSU DS0973]
MTLVVPPSPSGSAADEPTGPARGIRPSQHLPGPSQRVPADDAVRAAIGRLSGEFSGRVDPRLLVRVVRDCRRELGGSPVGALPELVERLARYRLDQRIG